MSSLETLRYRIEVVSSKVAKYIIFITNNENFGSQKRNYLNKLERMKLCE